MNDKYRPYSKEDTTATFGSTECPYDKRVALPINQPSEPFTGSPQTRKSCVERVDNLFWFRDEAKEK